MFCGVWQLTSVAYNDIGDSARTIAKWYVAPLAAGAVVLVVAVTVLGWWRPALFEVRRATPRWLSRTTTAMLGLLVVGSLLVGFCEELATRGVLVVGFRGSYNEPKVWLLSTLLFGLMHLPNWLLRSRSRSDRQVGRRSWAGRCCT